MPPTIYDSSLLTQRRKMKVESNGFIQRLERSQTSYAPRLGIYDQSILETVRMGKMKFYKKNSSACTVVSNGCPCAPLSSNEPSCCGTEAP